MQRICVFCGSSVGARAAYAQAARDLGRALADGGLGLVYGGGGGGLMGVLADATLAAGGWVTGVIPEGLVARELAHTALSELRVVHSMHERKAVMAELADGFVVLPGGAGTMEEFFEIWSWAQLGIHHKPCGILNVDGYYDPLLALFDQMVGQQFLRPQHRSLVLVETEPRALLARFASYRPPPAPQWIDTADT